MQTTPGDFSACHEGEKNPAPWIQLFFWLVVEPTHSEKICTSQIGSWNPKDRDENSTVTYLSCHHLVYIHVPGTWHLSNHFHGSFNWMNQIFIPSIHLKLVVFSGSRYAYDLSRVYNASAFKKPFDWHKMNQDLWYPSSTGEVSTVATGPRGRLYLKETISRGVFPLSLVCGWWGESKIHTMTSCHPFRWSMCRSLGCPKMLKQIPDKPLEENGREASRWCSRPTNVSFPVFLFKHVTLCLTLLPWSCNHDPFKEFLLSPIPNILKDVYIYISSCKGVDIALIILEWKLFKHRMVTGDLHPAHLHLTRKVSTKIQQITSRCWASP